MTIKYPDTGFGTHLKKNLTPIYVLMGQDSFLLGDAVQALKEACQAKADDAEEKRLYFEQPSDWDQLSEHANAYALFYDHLILDVSWNKKFDAKSKKCLLTYAENPNTRCTLILRAPLAAAKQCADLEKNKHIQLIAINMLNTGAEIHWIKQKLTASGFHYADDIPKRIQAYTKGSLHAANQAIERLALSAEPNTELTLEAVQEQLVDERQYKLYEISGACLDGNAKAAISLIRRAQHDQVEPTLILWFIAQELRLLEQLATGSTYQALKIYSFRTNQYQRAIKRLSLERIRQLLKQSQALDVQIKSGDSKQTWLLTEQLVFAVAAGSGPKGSP